MKVLIPGHRYLLYNFDDPNYCNQQFQFIHKEKNAEGEPETIADGTTNEEVLAMLIDRMEFLNNRFPCVENVEVIKNLENALFWLDKRTADRRSRGVEGTHKP